MICYVVTEGWAADTTLHSNAVLNLWRVFLLNIPMTCCLIRTLFLLFPKLSAVILMVTGVQYILFRVSHPVKFSSYWFGKFLFTFNLISDERDMLHWDDLYGMIRVTYFLDAFGLLFTTGRCFSSNVNTIHIGAPIYIYVVLSREKIHGEKAIHFECLPMQILDA